MKKKSALDHLFQPRSIAVIGATNRAGAVGNKVMVNLMRGGFVGKVFLVNPKHRTIKGQVCYSKLSAIRAQIDLAIITTPAPTVPAILEDCGQKNIPAAIIISAGFSEMGAEGSGLQELIIKQAKKYQIRFLGPNCLGLMRPQSGLNASFDRNQALPGEIALVSQSGAICAAILDWALEKKIGFSTIISMGNCANLDFGECLEYLAADQHTKSILLYIEGVHDAEQFVHGLRKAAQKKPVIVLKAGKDAQVARAVHSHTGALIGNDAVFSAVLARAGAVRVEDIEALFRAAQILASPQRVKTNRLVILSNGGGAGVMAADSAASKGLVLPPLAPQTLQQLNKVLPAHWSHQNPIDLIGDATPARYQAALQACLADAHYDAILVLLVPVAMAKPTQVAKELSQWLKKTEQALITCWMGEKQVKQARKIFEEKHIPCYETPEAAISAIAYLAQYHQHQELIKHSVPTQKVHAVPELLQIKQCLDEFRQAKRSILTAVETKKILAAMNIPIAEAYLASSAEDAATTAESLGFPVVMKIHSPDITHKQDVGGVRLNLGDKQEVLDAYQEMMREVQAKQAAARIEGVSIEAMYQDPHDRECMVGVIRDQVFGPAISFGLGGSLVEVIADRSIALPPLNAYLAKVCIAQSRAAKILGAFRGKPAANLDALVEVLLKIAALVSVCEEIEEMDINPLLVNEERAVVLDARIVLKI